MGVLDLREVEVLLPVRTFFLKGAGAVADLDPARGSIGKEARVLHVAKIFAFSHRALAESFIRDRLKEFLFSTRLQSCSHEIPHRVIISRSATAREQPEFRPGTEFTSGWLRRVVGYFLTTATASTSIIHSGRTKRFTTTKVLVGGFAVLTYLSRISRTAGISAGSTLSAQ